MSIELDRLQLVMNVLKAAVELGESTITACQRSAVDSSGSPGTQIEEFITVKEFLKSMGLSYGTYCRLRKEGKTPPEFRLSANRVRISRAEIEKWKARRPAFKGRKSKRSK